MLQQKALRGNPHDPASYQACHHHTKVAEKEIVKIIKEAGATSYTVANDSTMVAVGYTNAYVDIPDMKIEALVPERDIPMKISEEVTEEFFDDYSGMTYVCDAEVLHKEDINTQYFKQI
ncbi:MAG: hypothetical protein QNJ74_00060 [Trichodesmium sp. MO_231.B1]|uniref:hypothetical protein n=1 Tax=Okeania sp. SIO2F4 TaxID=2607790 RepID=UPI0025D6202E|nr:hypothetical protein [Okeania sp. SIO2F4]MDJ0514698.1 hypothetical protein [Trichodesmium sp. MO_231.B1]